VLTGELPEVVPVRLSYSEAQGTFSLVFMPWVEKKTMLQVHRVARHHSNSGELKPKAFSAFWFVTKHTEGHKEKPWEKLLGKWNELYNGAPYANRSSLASAYERAEKKLAGPWRDALRERATRKELLASLFNRRGRT
jgi:hypothetical protein